MGLKPHYFVITNLWVVTCKELVPLIANFMDLSDFLSHICGVFDTPASFSLLSFFTAVWAAEAADPEGTEGPLGAMPGLPALEVRRIWCLFILCQSWLLQKKRGMVQRQLSI